jgi:hypothetical protein
MMGEAAPPPKCPHHRGIGESHILFFKEFFMEQSNKRTRMNVSVTAKGLAQWEVTAEYETPTETKANLDEAIKLIRTTIKEQGLKEVGNE